MDPVFLPVDPQGGLIDVALAGGRHHDCRIVLGGVAPVPWRCRAAEARLEGAAPTANILDEAAEAAVAGAEPMRDSAYRVALARQAVALALQELTL